ncbi:MAG: thioredoxin domain-containing protein [Nitrospirae bacterium]|nr:MAG: thioredoxin domain-containing protein [Nitrospirota bacterium]
MNRLSAERSAYLKHSAYQNVAWYPWSEEAFEKAREEDKPVFLSTGAVWCHWCHVMARECFENEEIIKILNENFINIKLDRDERPDIDRRYQLAVAAMGYGGGWPLSVFLTPDKKPFFGGTYFPPEDSHGRPGFKKVLISVSDFYKAKRSSVYEFSEKLDGLLKPGPLSSGELNESMLNQAVGDILSEFDPQNGGFGTVPKFPMPGAMEFLINRYYFDRKESIEAAVKKTLEAMAKGGFRDHVGGGFHRYSTDEAWIIPHFEKMADDNAWLLRNYSDAYAVFGDEYYKKIAEEIIGFIRAVLSDPNGGFYASQDADVIPEDEGGYFTWTEEEFRRILDEDEYRVLSLCLFHERGSMPHDELKKVLFIGAEAEEAAVKTGMDLKSVNDIIKRGKEKLLKERNKRETPFIDRSLYMSLNGMLITSYLNAYRILKDEYLKDFSLKTLERLLKSRFINSELFHSEGVKAVLEDYIYLIEALIAAYEVSGSASYINQANELMALCIKKFWDETEAGFFDTAEEVLGVRLKAIEDIPHPSANALGIIQLLRLYHLSDNQEYLKKAGRALRAFSGRAAELGLHSGYYFYAADYYFNMLRLTLHIKPQSRLSKEALSSYSPYTSINYSDDKGYILPCGKSGCYEPVYNIDELKDFLRSRRKK